MSKPRKFFKSGYQHICQITADHGLFVYNIIDVIVLLSVLSVHAARRGIAIIALTIMLNHFHLEGKFASASQMDSYMNGATSAFARMYNSWYGLEGQLFQKPYCNSPKVKDEKIRDTFIYIGKNGVEKKACTHAWDYRFNFLKYLESNHPYSEEINPATASAALMKAMKQAKELREGNKHLSYRFVYQSLKSLDKIEQEQLIDYLITLYNILDKNAIISIFGSLENMKTVLDAFSGSEYDVKDDSEYESYRNYMKMISILRSRGYDLGKIRILPKVNEKSAQPSANCRRLRENDANLRTFAEGCEKNQLTFGKSIRKMSNSPRILSEREFAEICRQFRSEVGATDYEIKKFFHMLDA